MMQEYVGPEHAMGVLGDVIVDPETSVVYWTAASERGDTLANSLVFDEAFDSATNKALVGTSILDGIQRERELVGSDIDVGEFVQECVDEAQERAGAMEVGRDD